MRARSLLCTALACAASVRAQYFSEGWRPGQPAAPAATQGAGGAPAYRPGAQAGEAAPAVAPFDFKNMLATGPIGSLLAKAGVNLSQSLNTTEQMAQWWDPRIPLIHDDNYEEIIVREELTPAEEAVRTWFLIITTTAGIQQQGGISKLIDKQFDAAYNESIIENDLPDVRWGRIDYLNVTYLTTKWNIWQGPWLLVLRDRGQSLRFYKANQVRLNSTVIRNFLKEELWAHQEPWNSAFAPGGKREFVMHYLAQGMRTAYDFTSRVPKFVLMIMTGALGSLIMRLLHRPPKAKPATAAKPKPKAAVAPAPTASTTPPGSPTAKKSGNGKGKKNGKK